MRKLLFMIALMSAGRVLAVAPIGPAASTLEKGQLELGFDFARTKFDDLPMDVTFKGPLRSLGSVDTPLNAYMNGYWANVGYGLVDPLDVFLRLGAVDLDSAGAQVAWGLGVRATVAESKRLDWGVLAQVTWFGGTESETTLDPTFGPVWGRWNLDFAALQIAAGPVYKGDGFSVYGGPFLYWLRGDGDMTIIRLSDGATVKNRFDMESDILFGGYVGLLLDLAENLSIGAEAQLAADSQTFALSLTCRF